MSGSEPHPGTPEDLGDRYGSARRHSSAPHRGLRGRRAWFAGVALVVVLGIGSYLLYTHVFATPIDGQRVAFDELPGNAMEVTVDVNRDDSSRAAVCVVRLRDISGAESGRREIYVAPDVTRLTTVVRSIDRPVTADVYGCSYDVPEYLSTPVRPTE